MIELSIIVPCRNEVRYINGCINSILHQDFLHEAMEVWFVDGMSTDGTRQIITDYCTRYPFMHMVDNQNFIVPSALNIGIAHSTGNVVMRLDVHTTYASSYVSTLVAKLAELKADNVGCACNTDVIESNPKSLAIKTVMSSRFGVGNSVFRVGTDVEQLVDTVPFGCYRRDVFDRFGMFDERLARNQDIEFNKRIINGGGKIYLIPQKLCTYYTRCNFSDIARSSYQNGLWNILTIKITGRLSALSVRHLVPVTFMLSLILPILLSPLMPVLLLLPVASLSLYIILLMFACLHLMYNNKSLKLKYLIAAFSLLHTSYGVGSIIAFFVPIKKR